MNILMFLFFENSRNSQEVDYFFYKIHMICLESENGKMLCLELIIRIYYSIVLRESVIPDSRVDIE